MAASSCSAGRIRGRIALYAGKKNAECGGGHRHVPDLQGANESQRSDCRNGDHVDRFHGDDDGALADAVGREPTHQHEGDQTCAKARGHQRQRRGVVVEFDDLKRHHDGPHAFGEDRQGHRGKQQSVLTELEGCEHAPTAGVGHRLLNVVLRTHH